MIVKHALHAWKPSVDAQMNRWVYNPINRYIDRLEKRTVNTYIDRQKDKHIDKRRHIDGHIDRYLDEQKHQATDI